MKKNLLLLSTLFSSVMLIKGGNAMNQNPFQNGNDNPTDSAQIVEENHQPSIQQNNEVNSDTLLQECCGYVTSSETLLDNLIDNDIEQTANCLFNKYLAYTKQGIKITSLPDFVQKTNTAFEAFNNDDTFKGLTSIDKYKASCYAAACSYTDRVNDSEDIFFENIKNTVTTLNNLITEKKITTDDLYGNPYQTATSIMYSYYFYNNKNNTSRIKRNIPLTEDFIQKTIAAFNKFKSNESFKNLDDNKDKYAFATHVASFLYDDIKIKDTNTPIIDKEKEDAFFNNIITTIGVLKNILWNRTIINDDLYENICVTAAYITYKYQYYTKLGIELQLEDFAQKTFNAFNAFKNNESFKNLDDTPKKYAFVTYVASFLYQNIQIKGKNTQIITNIPIIDKEKEDAFFKDIITTIGVLKNLLADGTITNNDLYENICVTAAYITYKYQYYTKLGIELRQIKDFIQKIITEFNAHSESTDQKPYYKWTNAIKKVAYNLIKQQPLTNLPFLFNPPFFF